MDPLSDLLSVLRAVDAAGGFVARVADRRAAEACVERGWLIPEEAEGFALTLDGTAMLKSSE